MEIPTDVLESAHLTVSEAKVKLAIALFAGGRLSQGKAAELAGMPAGEFQLELGRCHIGPHYNEADAREDAATLAALRRSSSSHPMLLGSLLSPGSIDWSYCGTCSEKE